MSGSVDLELEYNTTSASSKVATQTARLDLTLQVGLPWCARAQAFIPNFVGAPSRRCNCGISLTIAHIALCCTPGSPRSREIHRVADRNALTFCSIACEHGCCEVSKVCSPEVERITTPSTSTFLGPLIAHVQARHRCVMREGSIGQKNKQFMLELLTTRCPDALP